MQTHNSPLKAIREKCLECSCEKPIKPNLSDEAREMLRQRALKNLSRSFVEKTDLESNDKEIGGEE